MTGREAWSIARLAMAGVACAVVAAGCGGSAPLYVDNGSSDPLTITVDGRKVGEVPAHDIALFRVRAGTREVEAARAGQTFDKTESIVQKGQFHIFSPKGMGTYRVCDIMAADVVNPKPGQPRRSLSFRIVKTLSGRRWFSEPADFGLLDPVPPDPGKPGIMITQRKLQKVFPASASAEEALTALAKNSAAFVPDIDGTLAKAVDALSAAGLDARGVEVLMVCLTGKPVSGLEEAAARALMSKLAPQQIRDVFTTAADTGKAAILKEMANTLSREKAEELAPLRLEMGLEAVASANPATAALGLGLLKDVRRVRDPAYVQGVDEALARVQDESMRRARETDWCRFLTLYLAGTTDPALLERLDQLAFYPDAEVQGRAAFALLAAGRVQRVLDAYPQMLPKARAEILRQIEAAPATSGIAPLLQIALEDGVSETRAAAFRAACRTDFPGQEAGAQRLVAALRAERDIGVAAEMKRALQDVASGSASRTCDSLLFWAVEEGGSEVAAHAVQALAGSGRDAARNWKMLCDRFTSIASEANRAAAVQACGAFRVDAGAKVAFCQRALRDPAIVVRECAFMQLCTQFVSLSEEQRLSLKQMVMAENNSQLKARMDQSYRLGMLAVFRAMPETQRREENVQQQICQHVLNGSESVAVEALKILDGTTSDPVSILLTKAFVRGTPTVKARILWTLHLHPNARVLDLLCTALKDKYSSVRKEAFNALAARYGVKHEKAGLALLQNAVQTEQDATIRSSFELALSRVTP